jgi:drug/metabolite transporter (DMT)-like permease
MYSIGTYLFRHYTVTFLSFAGFTTPLFAALFGKIFLGESVGLHFFFSLAVVSLGLWLFYGEEIKQGYIID